MTTAPPMLDLDHVRTLADDLIRALTPHAGDPDAVTDLLRRWLDALETPLMPLVCSGAVRRIFADCLTVTPHDQMPPGSLALQSPQD